VISRAAALIVLLAAATPAGAQSLDRFDGIYVLRSTTLVPGSARNGGRRCSFDLGARPLHIVHGHASAIYGHPDPAEGDIGADGMFTLMNSDATRELKGQVDTAGTLTGYLNTFDGCGYDLIYRLRAKP
jgi:hypothetical protein